MFFRFFAISTIYPMYYSIDHPFILYFTLFQ